MWGAYLSMLLLVVISIFIIGPYSGILGILMMIYGLQAAYFTKYVELFKTCYTEEGILENDHQI
jgi:hypothetical protein